jgi:glutaredoxin-related protein
VPAIEAQLARFRAAHTQVLGVSIDSVHSHANWAKELGGVSFPLLSDFHPKGLIAQAYGAYLDAAGITDRATVLIDSGGVVRHASSVTPSGRRDAGELAALCEALAQESKSPTEPFPTPKGIPEGSLLYIKSRCEFSRSVLVAMANLHIGDQLPVKNVSDDPAAREELNRIAGKDTAPCLIIAGKPMHESKDIIRWLGDAVAPL